MKKLMICLLSLVLLLTLSACDELELDKLLGEVGDMLGEGGELESFMSGLEDMVEELQNAETGTAAGDGMQGYAGDGGADLKNVTADNYAAIAQELFGIDIQPESGWELEKAESPNKVNNLNVHYQVSDGTDAKTVLQRFFEATLAVSGDGVYRQNIDWDTYQVSKGEKYNDFESFLNAEVTYSETLCSAIWIYDYSGRSIQFSFSLMSGTLELGMVLLH